jgi:hypothetical protein
MDSNQSVIPKKRRGPQPTGKGAPVMLRIHPPLLGSVDAWIAVQEEDPRPSRPEAIRRILAEYFQFFRPP